MGSGVLLAAVVVAWFVVLVPMMLTRRDHALEVVIRENDTSSARVLSRKPKMSSQRKRSFSMSESSPSHELDTTVDTGVHDRLVDAEPEYDSEAEYDTGQHYDDEPRALRERGPRRTDSARHRMIERRRRTLVTLVGVVVFTLALAVFAGSWTWVLASAAGVAFAAYLVHLRNEARREDERRLTREVRANRARTDVLGRDETRTQSSLAANAFVASGVVEPDVVLLDDEDPELYDLSDAPVADSIDLSGHRYSEYQDSPDYYDWDYDATDVDIPAITDDDESYRRAV